MKAKFSVGYIRWSYIQSGHSHCEWEHHSDERAYIFNCFQCLRADEMHTLYCLLINSTGITYNTIIEFVLLETNYIEIGKVYVDFLNES